jgi:hypothetical protein
VPDIHAELKRNPRGALMSAGDDDALHDHLLRLAVERERHASPNFPVPRDLPGMQCGRLARALKRTQHE